jgi:DNA-directed RNA polymerase subunit RPC12/RpoP
VDRGARRSGAGVALCPDAAARTAGAASAVSSVETQHEKQFPCGRCGAKLDFLPGSNALKCPYCGFENEIEAAVAKVEELDYRTYFEKAAEQKETHEAQRVRCEKCGAETTLPANVTSGFCPFCGANMVLTPKSSALIRPEGLLPFKVTQAQAFADFREWIRRLWFAPGDLTRYAQSEGKLAGVYIPFWTYDSDTLTAYTGARGDYYYTTETYTAVENGRTVTRTRQVRHTRWTPASGQVSNCFDDILIIASNSLPKRYADRLEPWDLKNILPYADDYLSGFRAESYQVTLPQGFEQAKEVMAGAIHSTIAANIGGDEQRIDSTNTQYLKITFKHLLLPVWLSAYRFHDRVFRILINARTGEVQGERPYSVAKIVAAVIAAIVLIAIIAYIANLNQ